MQGSLSVNPTRTVFSWVARDSLAVELTFLQSSGEWEELTGYWDGKKHFGQNTALMPGFVTGTYWVEGEREKNENVKTINQTKNLRQVDLRNGLIQIFLFDRWTEFLALYSGSYGVRPRAGWGGRGGQTILDSGAQCSDSIFLKIILHLKVLIKYWLFSMHCTL